MDFAPKAGPVVAELLSGFTALLLGYFALPIKSNSLLHPDSVLAAGALTLIAWLLGTFIDAVRNLVVEHVWDWLPGQAVNWRFFVHGNEKEVANCERYFFSFYMVDVDMAIAVGSFLLAGPYIVSTVTGTPIDSYPFGIKALLTVVMLVFAADAVFLRNEIRDYIIENESQ
jgi:hypothetical protein